MPVIEAMACGVPVVCSSHESMDEACGDAAVRADPESPEAIAAAIEDALDGAATSSARRGLAHAATLLLGRDRPRASSTATWRRC